jgi:hypothetical protein
VLETRTGCCDISCELCFQQGGATAYVAHKLMCCLKAMFPGHSILHFGDNTWPIRSPDFSVLGTPDNRSVNKQTFHAQEFKEHRKVIKLEALMDFCYVQLWLISDHN